MTLTRCLAKLCPLMNELKQAYLPNKHNKPAKFFLTFADALGNSNRPSTQLSFVNNELRWGNFNVHYIIYHEVSLLSPRLTHVTRGKIISGAPNVERLDIVPILIQSM